MSKPLRSLRLSPKSDYSRFTGNRGEIFYDPVNNTLRVFNSTAAGGDVLATRSWVLSNNSDISVNRLSSDSDINIDINLADSTLQRWRFGEDGELTFPDGTAQNTAFVLGEFGQLTVPGEVYAQYFTVRGGGSPGSQIGSLGYGGDIVTIFGTEGFNIETGEPESGPRWQFSTAGELEFPDETVQTTAFLGSSNDDEFIDNSNTIVPTEQAVRGYIDRRLGYDYEGVPVEPANTIGPVYVNEDQPTRIKYLNTAVTADSDQTVDALEYELATWIAGFTQTRTLNVSNLTLGRKVMIYVRNTNGSSRTINVQASASASSFTPVNLAVGAGAVSATSVTLAATTGTSVITLFNVNNTLVGWVN